MGENSNVQRDRSRWTFEFSPFPAIHDLLAVIRHGSRDGAARYARAAASSAVVGSMMVLISCTESAGNPPCLACSRTISAFGAM